ncbi:MAG: hypothetical protein ABSD53_08515 [Terriglobales bacterium]
MKTLFAAVVMFLAIFVSGCNTSATPVQGPPGQPGAQGQSGQQGQQGVQGQSGQQGYQGDQGQSGQQGQQGHRGDEGQQGQSAPCPAGQHRHTDPTTGDVRCVRDSQ